MFGVFDNNRPATGIGNPSLDKKDWTNHLFSTYDEAFDYASQWVNAREPLSKDDIPLNTPYDYNGWGDMIEIREV